MHVAPKFHAIGCFMMVSIITFNSSKAVRVQVSIWPENAKRSCSPGGAIRICDATITVDIWQVGWSIVTIRKLGKFTKFEVTAIVIDKVVRLSMFGFPS